MITNQQNSLYLVNVKLHNIGIPTPGCDINILYH